MSSAFAIEEVTRLAGAFALTLMRLAAAVNVGAGFVAADDFLLGRGRWRFRFFGHIKFSLKAMGQPERLTLSYAAHALSR
jgi:hypothetical protein